MKRKIAWKKYDESDRKKIFEFNEEYKDFLTKGKTERECNDYAVEEIEAAGYRNLDCIIKSGETLKSGDKVYRSNMGKGIVMFQIGEKPLEDGMNILGAHIDSPRLDLKQNPLYEDNELAFFETHYYGGIKKYQWTTRPMALHGVVAKKDGSVVNISIGENESDPVVGISELLIHLSADQMKKRAAKAVEGEDLNILLGSIPMDIEEDEDMSDEEKEAAKNPVKAMIMKILTEKYGIEEEDFLSAEIEVVPAGPARDYGLDRSMIMSYGHDDRVCAFPSYRAMLELPETVERTCVCLLVDKEEIGSVGATGMHSRFFENTVAEVIELTGGYSHLAVMRALQNSVMLSSDVSAAFDPIYPSVMEKNNCAYLGKGVVFNKYTGSGGKYDSNDASAEYIARIRKVFDDEDVYFQTAELGKVDQGGGGTIAYIMGNYGMNVIDSGVAVLSMHAPGEIVSKVDVYEAFKGYVAFLKDMK